jgi:hypothetical protein
MKIQPVDGGMLSFTKLMPDGLAILQRMVCIRSPVSVN